MMPQMRWIDRALTISVSRYVIYASLETREAKMVSLREQA